MKKFSLLLCMTFCLLITVTGSQNQEQTQLFGIENNEISISQKEVVVGAASNSNVSVEVNSQKPFYVICSEDWLSSETYKNNALNTDKAILRITARLNVFTKARTGTVRVYNDFGGNHLILVTQTGNTLNYLEINTNKLTINASQDSIFQVAINSNATWTTSSNQSWITVSKGSGTGNGAFGISAESNSSSSKREAVVTVSIGSTTKTINVIQWGQSQKELEVSTNNVFMNYYWFDSVKVDITSNTTWTATSNQDWLIVDSEQGINNGNIYIRIKNGYEETSSQGTISIIGNGATTKIITVTLNMPDDYYITVPKTSYTINTTGFGLLEIPVSSNTSWTASSNYNFFEFTPSTGFGNGSIIIVANPLDDDYEAELWIEQRDYEGDIEAIQVKITLQGQSQAFIEPDAMNATIATEGDSAVQLTVYSNLIWTATSNQPWLLLSNTTQEGFGQFFLKATANTSSYARYSTITISAPGYSSKTISVTQPGNGIEIPKLESLTPALEINAANGSTRVIDVSSNLNWTAVSDQSWLTLSNTSGSNDGSITITATSNNLNTPRQAFVTLSATGVSSVTIIVTQAAASATQTLAVSSSSVNIAAPAGSTASATVTSNTAWTAASNQSWLTVSPTSGSNNGELTFTATSNTGSTTRQAIVTVSGTGVTPVTIIVTQAAATATQTLAVSNSSVNIAAPAGSTASVTVTSNIAWTAASNQSWLTVSPTSGSNNGELTFTATANTESTTRQAIVTVSGTGVTPVTITVTQAAASILIVDEGSTNITIGPESGTTITINIQSNTSWTATSNQTWLHVSPASGTNNGTITVTADPNTLPNNRQGTITINANGVSITIIVNQTSNNNNLINVTFSVDMTHINLSSNEVFLSGSFTNWERKIPLTANGNIWSTTIQLPKNETIYYKFLYKQGATEFWEDKISGSCITTDEWKNRIYTLPNNDVTLDLVYYNQCHHTELKALAGSDQTVNEGDIVTLSGNYTGAFQSNEVTYQWVAPEGITLSSISAQNPTFTAPQVDKDVYYVLMLIVSSGTITSAPDEVTILVKNSTNTSVDHVSQSSLSVYPNPSSGMFEVDPGIHSENYQITVLNAIGSTVYQTEMNQSGKVIVNISNQQKGIYFVNIRTSKTNRTKKVILK